MSVERSEPSSDSRSLVTTADVHERFVCTALESANKFGYREPRGLRPDEAASVSARALARLQPLRRGKLRGEAWELLLFRREFLKTLASASRLAELRAALAGLGDETLSPLCARVAAAMEFDPRSASRTADAFDPLRLDLRAEDGESDFVRDARLSFVVAFMQVQEDGVVRARLDLVRVARSLASSRSAPVPR